MAKLTKEALKDIQRLIALRERLADDIDKLIKLRPAPMQASDLSMSISNDNHQVYFNLDPQMVHILFPIFSKILFDKLEHVDNTLRLLNVTID